MKSGKKLLEEATFISTLSEFVEYVRTKCSPRSLVLFRGQQSMYYDLHAPIARPSLRLKDQDICKIEQTMFDDFKRRSVPFHKAALTNDWELLALARHHGLPTRLLDWTTSALASLWFAVSSPATATPNVNGESEFAPAIVWIYWPAPEDHLQEKDFNKSPFDTSWRKTKVFQPRHITDRIISQNGWFTVHMFQSKNEKFLALNKIRRKPPIELDYVLVPPESFAAIRLELDRCGINEGSLFPGLDGICDHIKRNNSYLSDEVDLDGYRFELDVDSGSEEDDEISEESSWTIGTRIIR